LENQRGKEKKEKKGRENPLLPFSILLTVTHGRKKKGKIKKGALENLEKKGGKEKGEKAFYRHQFSLIKTAEKGKT